MAQIYPHPRLVEADFGMRARANRRAPEVALDAGAEKWPVAATALFAVTASGALWVGLGAALLKTLA
ncbi:MAG: hypothetical protein AAGH48_03180 [Pseudomonadota bacterium]